MPSKIEISHKTVIFTVFFLVFLWFIFQIRQIIFWVFVALILMSSLKPVVELLEKVKIPRILSILIIYFLLIIALVFTGSYLVPPVISETVYLIDRLPGYLQIVVPFITLNPSEILTQIAPFSQSIVKLTVSVLSNIVTIFSIIVLSIYMLIERKNLDPFLSKFLGKDNSLLILEVIIKLEERLGSWMRGQLLLGVIIGLMTFLGLTALNLPYVLPLSIIAGFLEVIPNIGPVISSIPAIIIALTISPVMGLLTVILYILIQQLENHLIVPLVMNKIVGLPPLVTIVAMLVGAKLGGFGGVLLSIPMVVAIETVISQWLKYREST